jgi:hypothetical protein
MGYYMLTGFWGEGYCLWRILNMHAGDLILGVALGKRRGGEGTD